MLYINQRIITDMLAAVLSFKDRRDYAAMQAAIEVRKYLLMLDLPLSSKNFKF